ncbi:MAG: hypothetical protein DWQ02_25265 [Bacteroidetes bacterium]|nr:MAG: hypothetical protein DWQ02_25265 [Bacteroidota bacterium]
MKTINLFFSLLLLTFLASCVNEISSKRKTNLKDFKIDGYFKKFGSEFHAGIKMTKDKEENTYLISEAEDDNINLLKLNRELDTIWVKSMGGEELEFTSDILFTPDQELIVLGDTRSFGAGKSDYYVNKVSLDGDVIWTKTFGSHKVEGSQEIVYLGNDKYMILGTRLEELEEPYPHSLYVVQIDRAGTLIFEKTMFNDFTKPGSSIANGNNDGVIILGTKRIREYRFHLVVMAFDEHLNELWTLDLGETVKHSLAKIIKTSHGFLVVSSKPDDGVKILVTKISDEGKILWKKKFGDRTQSFGNSIKQVSEDEFLIFGPTISFEDMDQDNFIAKITGEGELIWQGIYGGHGYDNLRDGIKMDNGNYLFCGTKSFKTDIKDMQMVLLQLDENGTPFEF